MIEGRQIHLRTVKEKDLGELFDGFSSLRSRGEYLSLHLPSEPLFRKEFLETGFWQEQKGMLVVCFQDRIVGSVWFEKMEKLEGLSLYFYVLKKEDRGRGYMSEGLSLFTSYLFSSYQIERLQICIPDYSKAALQIVKKNGFQFEGILRRALFQRGDHVDICLYSLLRSDVKPIAKISLGC